MISADNYYSYLELVLRQIDVFKLPEIWSPFSEEEENTWGWWCCDPYAECWAHSTYTNWKKPKGNNKMSENQSPQNFSLPIAACWLFEEQQQQQKS